MNDAQHKWFTRMTANVDLMRSQYHTTGIDQKLKAHTSRQIQEAVRRLQQKTAMGKIVSEQENAAGHEFWDGEADAHVEWLRECLRVIAIYTQPQDEDNFDEAKEWEKHCDYLSFLRHGNDPEWAQ